MDAGSSRGEFGLRGLKIGHPEAILPQGPRQLLACQDGRCDAERGDHKSASDIHSVSVRQGERRHSGHQFEQPLESPGRSVSPQRLHYHGLGQEPSLLEDQPCWLVSINTLNSVLM